MEGTLMSKNDEFEEVLRFWFSSLPTGDHAAMARQMEWWFRGGADAEIIERFSPLFVRAPKGELDNWSQSPRSRLALVIVLDQFSRTIHRGTAQAFAQDPTALRLALENRSRSLRRVQDTLGENVLLLAPRTFPKSSRIWSERSISRRNSSKTRGKNIAACSSYSQIRPAAIATSSPASAAIRTAMNFWDSNQPQRNSST